MRKIYLLLQFILLIQIASAQTTWEQAMNFGGAGNEVFDLRYSTNGDLYFLATVMGKAKFAGQDIDPGGYGPYPLTNLLYGKIAQDGTQTLIKNLGANSVDVLLDKDCNAYMIAPQGTALSATVGASADVSAYGMYLVKITTSGNIDWAKKFSLGTNANYGAGGVAGPNIVGKQILDNGNIYVVAAANATITDPADPENGRYPTRIIKFNTNGEEVWHFQMTSNIGASTSGINTAVPRQFVDNDGNVSLVVQTSGQAPKFNNATLASTGSYGGYTNWFINVGDNGLLKWYNSNTFTPTLRAVDPVSGKIYLFYAAILKPAGAPYSTLPNLTVDPYFSYGGILTFDQAGNMLTHKPGTEFKWGLDNMLILPNGKFLFYGKLQKQTVLAIGADYLIYNASEIEKVLVQTDANFNSEYALKTEAVRFAYQDDKIAMGGSFNKTLTLGSFTLTPTYNDPTFATRFPIFGQLKADIFIARFNPANPPKLTSTTWLGNNTNWNDVSNWDNGLPTGEKKAIINNVANLPAMFSSPVAGNLVIGSGANITLPSTLTITGKLVNDGKVTVNNPGFFQVFGASEIAGSGEFFLNSASASSLYYFGKISNTLSFNHAVSGDATVGGLKFVGATAKITGNVTITSNDVNAVSGQSTTSYVVGTLTRAVSSSGGAYAFPVGTNSNYQNVVYTPIGVIGTSSLAVKFTSGTPTGTTPAVNILGNTISTLLNAGYWTITPDAQPTAGTYSLGVSLKAATNLANDVMKYVLIKRDNSSSVWKFQGDSQSNISASGTGTSNFVNLTLGGINSFSDFAVGISPNALPIVLSVNLTHFDAKADGNRVLLNWKTASEVTNSHFEVEKSLDGSIFNSIANVTGAGTTDAQSDYSATDLFPANGINYYRLKQVDKDGKFNYSKVLAVQFGLAINAVSTYPNPAKDVLNFTTNDFPISIQVRNTVGNSVYQTKIFNGGLVLPAVINNGIYLVEVTTASGKKTIQQVIVSR